MKMAERDPLVQPIVLRCEECDEKVSAAVYWDMKPWHRDCLRQFADRSKHLELRAEIQAVLAAPAGQRPVWLPRKADWDAAYLRFIRNRYQCTASEAALMFSRVEDYSMDAVKSPGLNVTEEGQFVVPPENQPHMDHLAAVDGLVPHG
jgi:hypothetical protein